MVKKMYALWLTTLVLFGSMVSVAAAPVVVVPGESAGYVYYSASGGSGTPTTPVTDTSFVGMVAAFSKTPPTDTWVVCNGQTISAGTYPELVEFLAGSAAASAVMPNYQGYFLRGVNAGGSGVDAGRALGSAQGPQNLSHTHAVSDPGHAHGVADPGHAHSVSIGRNFGAAYGGDQGFGYGKYGVVNSNGFESWIGTAGAGTGIWIYGAATGVSVAASGLATETRPYNISVIYAMRAK